MDMSYQPWAGAEIALGMMPGPTISSGVTWGCSDPDPHSRQHVGSRVIRPKQKHVGTQSGPHRPGNAENLFHWGLFIHSHFISPGRSSLLAMMKWLCKEPPMKQIFCVAWSIRSALGSDVFFVWAGSPGIRRVVASADLGPNTPMSPQLKAAIQTMLL